MEKFSLHSQVDQARLLAKTRYAGKTDKYGQPYLAHLDYVAAQVDGDREKIAAYLHDIMEDTKTDIGELRAMFDGEAIDAVELLTHKNGHAYSDYIYFLSNNAIARAVKIASLTYNLSDYKEAVSTDEERWQLKKYQEALETLREKT